MVQRMLSAAAVASFGWLLGGGALAAQPPAVVASIKPVHSLVAGVMRGVGEPVLLVEGTRSPHGYSLRPSQATALSQAHVVFWVGENLETFLVKPLEALAADARVVELSLSEGVGTLPTREGGMWEGHHHEQPGGHEAHETDHAAGGAHDHGAVDMHIWLDPHNADAMVEAMAAALSEADPDHASAYRANAAALRAELARLDAGLADELAPVRGRPFVVFHDAYQYFEARYGLNAAASITVDPQRRPGARRLQEIRAMLDEQDAACVFAEPQFEPALVDTVIEGTAARKGVLDPLGVALDAGPDQYFELLRTLARSLTTCLGRPPSG